MSIQCQKHQAPRRLRTDRKKVYGVGLNDADYNVSWWSDDGKRVRCIYYITWKSMLCRGYDPIYKTKYPTYEDCTVCKEWLSFMVFKIWMTEQDWVGKELDKDLIVPGNKIYSPSTCCFLSRGLNGAIVDVTIDNGLLQGVRRRKGGFYASARVWGKTISLGLYQTEIEAGRAYLQSRAEYMLECAGTQTNLIVRGGFLSHANVYKNRLNNIYSRVNKAYT